MIRVLEVVEEESGEKDWIVDKMEVGSGRDDQSVGSGGRGKWREGLDSG